LFPSIVALSDADIFNTTEFIIKVDMTINRSIPVDLVDTFTTSAIPNTVTGQPVVDGRSQVLTLDGM
jgi:hypothetical protein